MSRQFNLLVSDAGMLTKAAVEGKLDTRADPTRHQGDFKRIVEGVNDTLDAVIGPSECCCGNTLTGFLKGRFLRRFPIITTGTSTRLRII